VTRALAVLLALPLCACDKLAAFDLAEGESYCGLITLGSGYRAGFGPRVQMRLRFDADAVELGESPGRITTFDVDAPDPDEEKRNPLLKEDDPSRRCRTIRSRSCSSATGAIATSSMP
jgi:hypothetical protein